MLGAGEAVGERGGKVGPQKIIERRMRVRQSASIRRTLLVCERTEAIPVEEEARS
jgi:hypothetical protein